MPSAPWLVAPTGCSVEGKNRAPRGQLAPGRSRWSVRGQLILVTSAACGPFCPWTISNSTLSPSARDLKPFPWMALKCTKTSGPPSREMKPNPFASLNHFTVPLMRALPYLLPELVPDPAFEGGLEICRRRSPYVIRVMPRRAQSGARSGTYCPIGQVLCTGPLAALCRAVSWWRKRKTGPLRPRSALVVLSGRPRRRRRCIARRVHTRGIATSLASGEAVESRLAFC